MAPNRISDTWRNLLALAAVFFFIIGLVMVTLDNRYFDGVQYLLTALLFGASIAFMEGRKVKVDFCTQNKSTYITLGFIFSVIGLSINVGVWALGISFFITGMYKSMTSNKAPQPSR